MYCIWSHSFVLWMFCLLSQNTEPESLYFINIILMGLLWIEYWSLSDYHGYFLKQWSLSWGQQVKIYKDSLKKIKFSLGKKIIKKDFTEKYRTEHDRNNVKQTIFHLQKTARREFRNGRREIQGRCQEVPFHMEDKMLGKEASVERSKVMWTPRILGQTRFKTE